MVYDPPVPSAQIYILFEASQSQKERRQRDIRSLPAGHNTEIIQYLPTVRPSKG